MILVLCLLIGADYLSAWTAPTAVPTGSNVAAPVNTGGVSQIKSGGLGVGALDVAGGVLVRGTSDVNDLDLTVTGRVGAAEYCDENGENCGSVAGGGWVSTNQVVYSGSITGSGAVDTGGIDLNLAAIVGARATLVYLHVTTSQNTTNSFTFKPKGVAGVQGSTVGSGVGAGASGLQLFGSANRMGYVTVATNAAGIILMQSYATQNVEVRLIGYIGASGNSASGLPACGNGETLISNGGVWSCGVPSGSTGPMLVNGQHSEKQCTDLGGTVYTSGADKFCQFAQASCPAGWALYQQWTTTQGGSSACTNMCWGPCYLTRHAWSNTTPETCSENRTTNCENPGSCRAVPTQVGCY